MNSINQNETAKQLKQAILQRLCNQIDLKKQHPNDRLPHCFLARLVASHQAVCPWLNRNVINNEIRRRKKKGIFHILTPAVDAATSATEDASVIGEESNIRTKGGRPVGSTANKRKHDEYALLASKNEIINTYQTKKKAAGKKRLPVDALDNLIRDVTKRNALPEDSISKSCIKSRLKKGRTSHIIEAARGVASPLRKYELEFVDVIIQMARMRESLGPSECVALINSLIDGKEAQRDLVEFKEQNSHGGDGTMGLGYWKGFKKRNGHLICSKRGQKYELDRDKWTTYCNFWQMYDHIYTELTDAGLAQKLSTPIW